MQGSETAGGGNVLALTTARSVRVGCKEDESRSDLLHWPLHLTPPRRGSEHGEWPDMNLSLDFMHKYEEFLEK